MVFWIWVIDQLNSMVDQLSLCIKVVLCVFDGVGGFDLLFIVNFVWVYLDVLIGLQVNCLVGDEWINWELFQDWVDWCDVQGLCYYYVYDVLEMLFDCV